MDRLFRKLATSLVCVLALISFARNVDATTAIMLSDQDLILSSRLILTGSVESVFSAWDDTGSTIWTYVEVKLDTVLKGSLSSETLILKQPGGIVGSEGVRFIGEPTFAPGDELLLYLNAGPDLSLHVSQCFMGMFYLLNDPVTGERYVRRWEDPSEVTTLQIRATRPDVTDSAPLTEYLAMIRDVLRAAPPTGAGGEEGVDFLSSPSEYETKRLDAQGYYTPAFNLLSGGVRWMEADAGQAVVYSMNPDRAPISGGGTAELTRAMSAWSAQSGANIRLQLGSQTSSCGYATDSINTISYGDCQGILDPPVNCSGVLAQTRIAFTSETKVVGGRTFRRLIDADLVFNRGMDCFLHISSNLAEVACHELGHSIGLDHASDPAAIMWASARGQGRDATLGDDDKAGVLAIYPASGGGGGSGSVSITTLTLPHGQVGHSYHQTLTATGGTLPYTWRLIGGRLPSGLSLNLSGAIDGFPSQSGTFQATVQVSDSTRTGSTSDSRAFTLTVDTQSSPAPVINRVKVKRDKKLKVYGDHFRPDSLLLLNGNLLTPKSFDPSGQLVYKGKLHLGPSGSNVVQVVNPGQTSAPFTF
jgi:hypothetical protein